MINIVLYDKHKSVLPSYDKVLGCTACTMHLTKVIQVGLQQAIQDLGILVYVTIHLLNPKDMWSQFYAIILLIGMLLFPDCESVDKC